MLPGGGGDYDVITIEAALDAEEMGARQAPATSVPSFGASPPTAPAMCLICTSIAASATTSASSHRVCLFRVLV
jgi:hypothetical protein